MPGMKIKIDTHEAKLASDALKKSLAELGHEAVDDEKKFQKLESRLHSKLSADKTERAVNGLRDSLKLSRLETAKLQARTGDLTGAFKTMALGADRSAIAMKAVAASATVLAGAYGVKAVSSSFLEAATTAEGFRTRLEVLLGSTEKGAELFDRMSTYAGKVPFEFEKVMQSATSLAGVMKGGVDEISQWMPMIGDLAAASGLSIEETTSQVIKMYSAGAASADMFRERGILAMMDFQAGVSYSAKETREQMMRMWKDPASQFHGATDKMADDWSGMISMMKDAWFQFRLKVMDNDVFEHLKTKLEFLLDTINDIKENGRLDEWADALVRVTTSGIDVMWRGLKRIASELAYLWDGFRGLPDWVKEIGIVGAMVGGVKGKIIMLGMIHMITTAKNMYDGFSQALKGNIKWTDLAIMNATELKEALENLRKQGIIPAEESFGGLSDLFRRHIDDWEAINKEINKNTESIKTHNVVHHQGTEEMIQDMYSYRHWWDETTESMGDDWAAINDEIEGKFKETVGAGGKMEKTATEGFDALGQLVEQDLTGMFQGQFDSIGGFFKDMFNSMYSMFTSFAAKLAAKKIVIPVVMSMVGGAASAFGITKAGELGSSGGGGMFGMPSLMTSWGDMSMMLGDTFSDLGMYGVADFLGSFSPTMLNGITSLFAGLPDLLHGNFASAGLTTAGAFLGGLTPLGPLGSFLGGTIGHIVGGLFGGGHKPNEKVQGSASMVWDAATNSLVPVGGYTPADTGDRYTGTYLTGWGKHTPHDFDQQMVEMWAGVDEAVSQILEGFSDWTNKLVNELPIAMRDDFSDAMAAVDFNWSYFEDDKSPNKESLESLVKGLVNNLNQSIWDAYSGVLTEYVSKGFGAEFEKLGINISEPLIDAGASMEEFQAQAQNVAERLGLLNQISEALNPTLLTAYDKALLALNTQFDGYTVALKARGATEEELIQLETYRTEALEQATQAMQGQVDSILGGMDLLLHPLEPLEAALAGVNNQFDVWIEAMRQANATVDELAQAENYRNEALAQTQQAYDDQIAAAAQQEQERQAAAAQTLSDFLGNLFHDADLNQMDDFTRGLTQLQDQWENARIKAEELGASTEQLALIQSIATTEVDQYIQAEQERQAAAAQAEQERQAAAAQTLSDFLGNLFHDADLSQMNDYDRGLQQLKDHWEDLEAKAIELGATTEDLGKIHAIAAAEEQQYIDNAAYQNEVDLLDSQISGIMDNYQDVLAQQTAALTNWSEISEQLYAAAMGLEGVGSGIEEAANRSRGIYKNLLGMAWGGDVSAAGQVGGAAERYINDLYQVSGSGLDYRRGVASVRAELLSASEMALQQKSSQELTIEAFKSEVADQLAALKQAIIDVGVQQLKSQQDTAKVLRKWDDDGQPDTRAA